MKRWMVCCALWATTGCVSETEVGSDGGSSLGLDAAVTPGPWFDVACPDGGAELVLSLAPAAACGDVSGDGLVLRLPDAAALAEGTEITFNRANNTVATYTVDGEPVLILDGAVRFDRWYASGLAGTTRVVLVGGVVKESRFEVRPCGDQRARTCIRWPAEPEPDLGPDRGPPPDAEPPPDFSPRPDAEPPPDAGSTPGLACTGRYRITRWTIEELAFDPQYINPLLAADLAVGTLRWHTVFAENPDRLQFENVQAGNGAPQPDPAVPESTPLPLRAADGRFASTGEARAYVTLGRPDYDPQAPEIGTLPLFRMTARGAFQANCQSWTGQLRGAFVDLGYSIPAGPDADTDGDGEKDGFWMGGSVEAVRVEP